MALRHYENFDVGSSVDRADTEATKFADFGGMVLNEEQWIKELREKRIAYGISQGRLAVAHVSAESVAFETAGNVADMADCPVNIVKKSFLFQVYKAERIADIVAAVINNFRLGADFLQLFLKRVAL